MALIQCLQCLHYNIVLPHFLARTAKTVTIETILSTICNYADQSKRLFHVSWLAKIKRRKISEDIFTFGMIVYNVPELDRSLLLYWSAFTKVSSLLTQAHLDIYTVSYIRRTHE